MSNKKKSDFIPCWACHKAISSKKIWYLDPEIDEVVDDAHTNKTSLYLPFCEKCLKRRGYK